MIRVGLVGGRGYVGAELLQGLDLDPNFEIAFVGSRTLAGQSVSESSNVGLTIDQHYQPLEAEDMRSRRVDVWVLAQPNGHAQHWYHQLESTGAKFLDVSFDYRFDNAWVYGLPEANRDQIMNADRVSNPGCYATATQLALLPINDDIVGTPVAFGVSGYSGAGKKPSERNDANRLRDNLIPYSLIDHGHQQEISAQLKRPVRFIPHVAQFFRGISVTVDFEIGTPVTSVELATKYGEFYGNSQCVKVATDIPEISQVRATPLAIVGGFAVAQNERRVAVVCVIDNLLKGAAAQALDNLRLMFNIGT